MVRVALVSYLNTTPFMYGLRERGLLQSPDFRFDAYYPSACAAALLEGRADVGLVPVAVLPQLEGFRIVGETCIGAVGAVRSVLLVSKSPLKDIRRIALDYQSRTSVQLCRLLCRDYWKIEPEFYPAHENYLDDVEGETAAVVIGDRAFDALQRFEYTYDLSLEWELHTGLPFVFAVWVAAELVSNQSLEEFLVALQWGVDRAETAALEIHTHYPAHYDLKTYLSTNISYTLDADKRKGLETFLQRISTL
jgi:chorismate dehydratase